MAHKYKKLSPIDHVLLRPEMYVGSVESQPIQLFLLDDQHSKVEWTTADLNHGLLKIFDEIVLNAADNIHNSKRNPMTFINVTIDETTGQITVENDGAGIPLVKSKDHKLLIPEMIFGHLLTSSNYDNDPDSMSAGRHGYGAKLTNIMSQEFIVYCRTADKEVTIRWTDHMRSIDDYQVQPTNEAGNLTKITFTPDFSVFGVTKLTKDMYRILHKRILDLAAAFPSVTVSFNGTALDVGSFASYVKLFEAPASSFSAPTAPVVADGDAAPPPAELNKPFLFEVKHLRLAFIPQPQASVSRRTFAVVNGVVTYSGGTHVQAAQQILTDAVDALVAQKKEGIIVTVNTFLRYFTTVVFLETTQPKFDSQSKVRLVSKVKFPRFPTGQLVEHLATMTFLSDASKGQMDVLNKELNALIQVPGKRRPMISTLTKLVDAASAGGSGSEIRTLIVTEGDSAKALALNSLSNEQRKYFGVFPLRGKLLNVRNNNLARLKKCKELCDLFAALGIEIGRRYTSTESLRYQRLLVMTDQDADGTHIKGLLISAFESLWPSLLQHNLGFISIFSTPLIRATTRGGDVHSFYNVQEFVAWKHDNARLASECFIKYYKGLGTSTTTEGKEYFKQMEQHLMPLQVTPSDSQVLDNVFDSDEVQWRKEWLSAAPAVEEATLDRRQKMLTIPTFVDKELIHFANAGNLRALPSAVDGLKPSQRKILWSCFRRGNANESLKVSQLSGYISEVSAFHHGEMSLQQTIIKMAQDYVGSNNINLLEPEGQFGSRQHLGSDHAAARYIFTKLSPLARLIFPKEDDELLQFVEDEGKYVEPRFYVPIIPMLLVNGSVGIGFGFACTVQMHHPLDVVTVVRRMMRKNTPTQALEGLRPWAVGYSGSVVQKTTVDEEGREVVSTTHVAMGRFTTRKVKGFPVVRVEELPWDRAIEQLRGRVAKLAEESKVLRIADYSGANHVDSDVVLAADSFASPREIEKDFLLTSNVANNAAVYNPEMVLSPLGESVESIVQWHYEQRLAMYTKRKERQLLLLNTQLKKLKSTLTFTETLRSGDLDFRKMADENALVKLCSELKLHRENDSFDYLTRRPVTYFTNNNVEKLKRDIEHCKSSIKSLESKSEVELWETDLAAFEKAFTAHEDALLLRIEADRRPVFTAPEVDNLSQQRSNEKWKFFRRKKGGSSSSSSGGAGGGAGEMVVREFVPPPLPNQPPAAAAKAQAKAQVAKFVGGVLAMVATRLQVGVVGRLLLH
ncbi:kinetoplast and nucleus-associated type II DNA topoisomerase, putative [Bodo saltans]|uniref:DNA topoisomerase 2 n=1 Tax=Bodo saltans TaxID=75058 RepID=A0A0S4JGE3_BODSA|nr:kinetoplast and nucleus-associated type II DNA topoisomerase, putative [Bodo saltans]|eukprot:CUG90622.1 kinetoplast and nucleus-associated type II DNA topoisomerase, putative [Bodo saltans]